MPDFVYLASASPRRRELLRQIGVSCQIVRGSVDETARLDEAPAAYVARLAAAKADCGWAGRPDAPAAPVLAADTAVVMGGRILGNPVDRQDALDMLGRLSGRTHEVLTAVALRTAHGLDTRTSRSEVTFRPITAAEAERYWATGEPRDKAGAYAIQGLAAIFIADLRGSYSGVMGLPLYETADLLALAGLSCWQAGAGGRDER